MNRRAPGPKPAAATPAPAPVAGAQAFVGISDALMRDALLGAGTSVWEWLIPSDELSNIDTSSALLGYRPGELRSVQAAWNELIHPDDRDENHAAYLHHALGEMPIYEHEYRARAKDGSWRWVVERGRIVERDARGEPLRMVGTLSDVTQRRLAQGDALAMAERLTRIARHVPGIVYQLREGPDGSAHFAYISESCERILGLPAAQLMADASVLLRLIERDDRPRMDASLTEARAEMKPWRSEFRMHLRDLRERWFALSATPHAEPGGGVVWHGYIEETTELRELEKVRHTVTAAQAANRAKTEFLSRMSHELRTPLNAVLGFAQLLEIDAREPLQPEQRKRVVRIREAGTHLLQMIGELLDLTRIESGQMTVELAPLAVAPLLAQAAEMLRPQADAAGIRLHIEPIADDLAAQADARRLRQVLINLLSNGIKYNRPGGAVVLTAQAAGDELTIRVEDTGVGIAPRDLATLFEPFNRGAHQRSTIEGTGIGLAVTRALVSLMNGRVEVRSMPGEGSVFSVVLQRVAGVGHAGHAGLPPAGA